MSAKQESVPPPKAYSIKDFCRAYGVGPTTFYEELNEGRLVACKIGRKTVVPADVAEAWFASRPRWTPSTPVARRSAKQASGP